MSWFAVDDRMHAHRKFMRLRRSEFHADAVALWTLAGSWAGGQEQHTGEVPLDVLASFGVPHWQEAIAALVDVDLWENVDDDTVRFHNWPRWNGPDAKQNRQAEASRRSSAAYRLRKCERGEHDRHCPPDTCPQKLARRAQSEAVGDVGDVTQPEGDVTQVVTPRGDVGDVTPGPSRPDPTPSTSVVSQAEVVAAQLSDDDLDQIRNYTGGDREHARKTAEQIITDSKDPVRDARAYVLRAVKDEPYKWRYHGTPMPPQFNEFCPTHRCPPPCPVCRDQAELPARATRALPPGEHPADQAPASERLISHDEDEHEPDWLADT